MSAPRPEITVGGSGEKKTLRLVARYADACNLFAWTLEEVSHKLDVLRGRCDAVGREYADIRKTMVHSGDPRSGAELDAFTRGMADYAELGIETVILGILGPRVDEPAEWIENGVAPVVERPAGLD